MNVLSYLRNIYAGRENLSVHFGLFSLIGIMTICLHNIFSSKLNNMFSGIFGFAPCARFELFLNTCGGVFLLFFTLGYIFNYAHNLYNDKTSLPEISMDSFSIFFKVLPIILTWGIYFIILFLLGMSLFRFGSFLSLIYFASLFSVFIFVNIIYVIFAKDFQYKADYFNPLYIIKVINCSSGPLILLSIELLLICILPVFLLYKIFNASFTIDYENISLGLRWMVLCITVYLINVIHYVYVNGLVEIIKERIYKE